jgi:glycosyltransferase involved in cell wall biosynthesis
VPSRRALVRRTARAFRNVVDPLPYTWAAYRDRRFTANLAQVLQSEPHDLLHCDQVQATPAVLQLPTPPRVLNAHNVDSLLVSRLADVEPRVLRKALIRWQARKIRRAEEPTYRRFHGCLAMSAVDRAHIGRIAPELPVWVIPNGVDPAWFSPQAGPFDAGLMVFSGAMDWEPNSDAVRFFVREVLPRIRRRLPTSRFLVVGRSPSPALVSALAADAKVEFTGTVDDIRPSLARAALFVVPLRVGSGTRLKILEAWAMGKPVLSTSLGAEGLPARDGENIAIADSPDELATRALELLEDPGYADRLGAAGRRTVQEQFSWEHIGHDLLAAYEAALALVRPDAAVPHV